MERRLKYMFMWSSCRPFFLLSTMVLYPIICSSILLFINLSFANCFVPAHNNLPFSSTGSALKLSSDEDFASFGENAEDNGGQQLANEFYQEIEYRRSHGEETYTTKPIRATKPLFTPASQKAAGSAGLFSGGGSTVYSSGRSIRAEIDILNRSMAEDAKRGDGRGRSGIDFDSISQEQLESLLRFVGVSLVFLAISGVLIEVSGGGISAITLMNDAAKDGISSMMIGVGSGDVFLREDAAWLLKESSIFAATIMDAVGSVKGKVLF
jgi:hypothetical protein